MLAAPKRCDVIRAKQACAPTDMIFHRFKHPIAGEPAATKANAWLLRLNMLWCANIFSCMFIFMMSFYMGDVFHHRVVHEIIDFEQA
jgi:hypothetical protein